MPRDSSAPLPRWARISKRQDDKEALSMEEEECYLRTRMHHSMAHHVDEALHASLETHVSPLVENIMSFFQVVSPSDDSLEDERPSKRARPAGDEDPLIAIFQTEPSQRYPVTMLPLATLHGPPSFLDRQEMMKFMVNKMRREEKEDTLRPAVCWLRSTGNSSIRHCGPFLQEILRQCIAQEPNPKQFHRLFDRTRASSASFSQALIMWAQYTVSFGSIIVFIDTVDCIPGPLFQDFLRILTQLRSEHRLPLQIVLFAPPGRSRQLGLDSSAQGMTGILVRDFSLPTSKRLYDSVWEQVFIERPLPMSLAPSVLRSMHESFDHHHASAVRAIQMLKQALAHSCTQRGAFLLGKNDASFKEDEERRISYFQCHHHSDTTLEYAKDAESKHSLLTTLMRLLHRIGVDVGGETLSGVEWAERDFSAPCFNGIRSQICKYFNGLTKIEKMTWLAHLCKELQSTQRSIPASVNHDAQSVPSYLSALKKQLNEIIVLTEEEESQKEDSFAKDLSQLVSEWVYNASVVGAALQTSRSDDSNRFSPAATETSAVDANAPQVRGKLTDALLTPVSGVDKSDFRAAAPCKLFLLMQDRVVISREECFEAFVKSSKGSLCLEDLCSAFAFGMHQLCYCGLVTEKLGSKNNVFYERTALVWCSGN